MLLKTFKPERSEFNVSSSDENCSLLWKYFTGHCSSSAFLLYTVYISSKHLRER